MEEIYKPTLDNTGGYKANIRFFPPTNTETCLHIAKKHYVKTVVWDEKEIMRSKRRKKLERVLNEDPFGLIQKQPICYVDENGKWVDFKYE